MLIVVALLSAQEVQPGEKPNMKLRRHILELVEQLLELEKSPDGVSVGLQQVCFAEE